MKRREQRKNIKNFRGMRKSARKKKVEEGKCLGHIRKEDEGLHHGKDKRKVVTQ